jgi:hypothetical protein
LRSLSPIRTHDVQPQTKWGFLLRSELFSILENRVLKIKKYFIFVQLLYRVESLIEHFSPKENTRKPTGILVNFYCMTVRKLCRISISCEGIPTRETIIFCLLSTFVFILTLIIFVICLALLKTELTRSRISLVDNTFVQIRVRQFSKYPSTILENIGGRRWARATSTQHSNLARMVMCKILV